MAAAKGYMAKIGLDLSDIDKQIKSLQRELNTVDKALEKNSDSAVLASQKYQILDEETAALTTKLTNLVSVAALANNALENGQFSTEEFRAYQREIEATSQALREVGDQKFPDNSQDVQAMAENVRQAREDVVSDLSTIQDQVADWTQSIADFGVQVGEVLIDLASECVEVGKQFETSMSLVAATGGLDKMSEEYQRLEDAAKQFGATTRYTASEAAEALNYLALAGYDVDKSISTLPNLLNLAQAGGLDFARSAEMLTNATAALGLSSGEMSELIDKMAVTARSSGTNVEQLGEAILRVGGTARSIKGGLTEMDTILGVLADNGIKASEGGTKLRNVLVKIAKPTKGTYKLLDELNMSFYDLEGNMRPLPEIFTEIREKMDELQLTQQERDNLISGAFNARDLAAINALLNTSAERYDELAKKINQANGASEQMATTMNDNLQGALYQLKSAREAVEIEIYQKIDEPLKDIVNNVADTVRGVSKVFEDESVAREFTAAFQKIADVVRQEMPNIIRLFEEFATKIVPRLGEVSAEIVELVGDKMLPKFIDILSWIIDNGAAVESAIKLIIGAMVVDKVGKFGQGLLSVATGIGKINGAIVDLAAKAPTAATGLTQIGSSAEGAAAGATAASTALGGILVVGEALIAATVLVANKLDEMGEAARRNTPYLNDFSDASNRALQVAADNAAGKYDDKTLKQADEAIEKRKQEIADTEEKIHELNDEINKLNGRKKALERTKEAAGLWWGLDKDTKAAKEELDSVNSRLDQANKEAAELRKNLEVYDIALKQEENTRERIAEQQEKDLKNQNINAAQNELNANKASQMAQKQLDEENEKLKRLMTTRDALVEKLKYNKYDNTEDRLKDIRIYSQTVAEIDKIENKRAEEREKQQREQEEAEAEAFAEQLEYQEELWDKKYHWDKENYKEYWEEKEKFLDEYRVDTKEWNQAWNETEKKLGKLDSNTEKEIKNNLKEAEQKIKDALDTYKNNLKHAVAEGSMTEYEANEALGHYLDSNLDKSTDLYVKEHTDYLNTKKKLDDQFIKDQEKEYSDNKKKQEELIKNRYTELETQARNENWSDQKLLNKKMSYLDMLKSNNTIYLEVYEDTLSDLRAEQSKINEKEREAQEKQREADRKAQEEQDKKDAEADKKLIEDYQKERKKIMESAQKDAENVLKQYYTKSRDELSKYAQSSQTVTDSKGKERLVFTDYSKKLQEIKVYQKNLKKLESMNLSNEHLKEIFSMDLDTRMKYISELVQMSGDKRAKYLSDYNKYQKTVASVTTQQLKFQSDEIKQEISEKYDDLVKDAELSGTAAAKAYVDAWNETIKGTPLEGLQLLSPELTGAADKESIKQTFAAGLLEVSKGIKGIYDKFENIGIVINIDNEKQVETAFKKVERRMKNNGAKAF